MPSLLYKPPAPLGNFVQCFWYWERDTVPAHTHERLMPTGESTIIFNLRDYPIRIYHSDDLSRYDTYGTAVFSGARSNYFVIDTEEQERVIGIQFHPGGGFPFFRIPADEAENRDITLEDLWRARVGELRERMLAAPSVSVMFQVLEQDLLAQLARPLAWHPAVEYALYRIGRAPHVATVESITDKISLSQRRFIQLFHQQVGITPKTFCRVRRFQGVLRKIHGMNEVEWAQVALDCGYYDQAHFIHDFQAFAGITPSMYLHTATPHLNHVPIL
ncbi:MAG TPA: helix-turn-helix domain-containing protein [Pseudacidobacterium sp.]|jgi:AraC-like DNA-binding protein|nr:helix-turn-helix domain-containing protein [Pseudacidobacterium sp.]